jgi:hypothetical protein
MRQWYWGCIPSIIWKAGPIGTRIFPTGPKVAFGQPTVNSAWVLNCLNFQGRRITITSVVWSLKAVYPLLYIYFRPGALWNNPSCSSIIPFSSNLQTKYGTTQLSFQTARRPARTNCHPTTPPRRTSPPTMGCLIVVLRGAPRRRTRRRRTTPTTTPMTTPTSPRLLPSERGEHDNHIFRLSIL